MSSAGWTVIRDRGHIRVDVTQARSFEHTDTEAIASAVKDYLGEDEVTAIRFDGPVLIGDRHPRWAHLDDSPSRRSCSDAGNSLPRWTHLKI